MNKLFNTLSKFRIGLRTIKTAIAVFICLAIYQVYPAGNPLYAAIAALICMKATTEQGINAGVSRFIGTIIGGTVGYILTVITPYIPYYNITQIFVIPLGIVICISSCVWMKRRDATIICCIVFLIIALNTYDTQETLTYVVLRVIDTTIGIVIGTMLNRFLFPYSKEKDENTSGSSSND